MFLSFFAYGAWVDFQICQYCATDENIIVNQIVVSHKKTYNLVDEVSYWEFLNESEHSPALGKG